MFNRPGSSFAGVLVRVVDKACCKALLFKEYI